jgi:hypothetical protein
MTASACLLAGTITLLGAIALLITQPRDRAPAPAPAPAPARAGAVAADAPGAEWQGRDLHPLTGAAVPAQGGETPDPDLASRPAASQLAAGAEPFGPATSHTETIAGSATPTVPQPDHINRPEIAGPAVPEELAGPAGSDAADPWARPAPWSSADAWARAAPTRPAGAPDTAVPGPLERLRARLGASRRRRDVERAVPEALDVLRATVSAGASPGQGLAAAADLTAGPLAPVLGEAARATRLGVSPGRALADAGARAECIELVTAGEALDLADVTGAPPGRVLAGVAAAAADRVRARQALMAATAEARLSARVIAGLGPAFLLLLAVVAPREVAFLFTEPAGWLALGLAISFEAAGLAWAARIVRSPL